MHNIRDYRSVRAIAWLFAGLLWAAVPGIAAADPLAGDALYGDLVYYADLGETKRSGTLVDRRASAWLSTELSEAGFQSNFQPWLFNRFKYRNCRLVIAGEEAPRECFSLWYPNNTTVRADTVSVVKVLGYKYETLLGRDRIEDAITAGASAVIAVNVSSQSLAAVNASLELGENPLPVPVILLGGANNDLLDGALESTRDVDVLRVFGQEQPGASTRNVVGILNQGAPRTVVISTPINGWFTAAGERGPGIALWLGIARWAVDQDLPVNLVFLASSGHELAYLGTRKFLEQYLSPGQVLFWMHLGASIVTQVVPEGELPQVKFSALDYSDPLMADALNTHLRPIGFDPKPTSSSTTGELGYIIEQGYRAFGFYGAFDKFHTKEDLADSTAPELLETVARPLVAAISEIIDTLSQQP